MGLSEERERAEFDLGAMMSFFSGGDVRLERSKRLALLAATDPVLRKDDRMSLTKLDLFKSGLKKALHVRNLVLEHNLTEEEYKELRVFADERSYADLHWNMFVPGLEGQATEEQQQKWLPLAKDMKIIGTYAQTELGHGSNVNGLETSATFDSLTDEFVLSSPTISSMKWWPGGLGKVATHALLYARLIIHGKDLGIHGFILQLRNMEDHTPLPGIEVADIGMKFGNNSVDNGLLRLNNVRIPRMNMLMRMSTVTRDGKYFRNPVPRQIIYGAMIAAREMIISEASINLSRAVTIAVRYSAVRRQFGSTNGSPEIQVLDYQTQQRRLFPLLAATYAFQVTAQWLKSLYSEVVSNSRSNNFSDLLEVHFCTAGLKALTTTITVAGIEECRKLCGGHGYMCSSGFPDLYTAYVPSSTYEGDTIVLLRQVGRFLLRTLSELKQGKKAVGTTAYLNVLDRLSTENCHVQEEDDWCSTSLLVNAFETRSFRLIDKCAKLVSKTTNLEAHIDEYAVEIVEAAYAHCQVIMVSKFAQKIQENIPGQGVKQQLLLLFYVYCLSHIDDDMRDFLMIGYLTTDQASLLRDQLRKLFSKVRVNAVALVDAFNHTDHFLGSVLGRYDGDVYNHMYELAIKDPFNKSSIPDGYEEYIKPLLKLDSKL